MLRRRARYRNRKGRRAAKRLRVILDKSIG
jgi:hypothetical protein